MGADTRDIRDFLHQSAAIETMRKRNGDAQRVRPQAGLGTSPDVDNIAILEDNGDLIVRPNLSRIREEWPAFFRRATENRMTVETNLP